MRWSGTQLGIPELQERECTGVVQQHRFIKEANFVVKSTVSGAIVYTSNSCNDVWNRSPNFTRFSRTKNIKRCQTSLLTKLLQCHIK